MGSTLRVHLPILDAIKDTLLAQVQAPVLIEPGFLLQNA